MKIGFTINIGDYESLKIESSECDNLKDCLLECYYSLNYMSDEFKVKRFLDKINNIIKKIIGE